MLDCQALWIAVFYSMDTRLLTTCFGTSSNFIFGDFMTDLLVAPICELMFWSYYHNEFRPMEPREGYFTLLGRTDFLSASSRMQCNRQTDTETPKSTQRKYKTVHLRPFCGAFKSSFCKRQEKSDWIKNLRATARSSICWWKRCCRNHWEIYRVTVGNYQLWGEAQPI